MVFVKNDNQEPRVKKKENSKIVKKPIKKKRNQADYTGIAPLVVVSILFVLILDSWFLALQPHKLF
jgi:hypothetical protein